MVLLFVPINYDFYFLSTKAVKYFYEKYNKTFSLITNCNSFTNVTFIFVILFVISLFFIYKFIEQTKYVKDLKKLLFLSFKFILFQLLLQKTLCMLLVFLLYKPF